MIPKKLKTVHLDLKLRHPRKYYFKFEDYFLIFKEPSFEDLGRLDSIAGIELIHKRFLKYCHWTEENLQEIIDFIDFLPFRIYAYLIDSLEQYFEVDNDIDPSDFEYVNYHNLSLTGYVNTLLMARKKYESKLEIAELFNKTMETLGVYIKASKPNLESDETEVSRSIAWVPLTQMINPEGYQSIHSKLIYDGPDVEKLQETEKSEKIKKDDTNNTNERKNERISLYSTLTREEHAKMIYENAYVGFLRASKQGISQNAYRSALEKGIDPIVRDDRTKLMTQNQEASKNEPVTLKSRWRGSK